ncbi:tyrosine-type recombinase/integrase [Bifidobacterium sp. ESL0798]|uniref:tyrosine-type recombinase/integrase n=1 Tax=Bifidobacterium sp. ESL0798 TaxID=2983235 RepID=UPI0023F96897|nr:tyrosine-type recombinase/integrase [Bifidobacterium sp. ESL0798]WEV74034.1 tyrosine-type recombinase/integrase [Bifidobacterium sp. ESL0798]
MARTANTWGTVRKKSYKTKKGTRTFYRAAYQNPKATPGHEVSKSFSIRRDAESWLSREHDLVQLYWRGQADWIPPQDREKARRAEAARKKLSFAEYANNFVENYRTKDGRTLVPDSKRKKDEALAHLLDGNLADKPLADITTEDVNIWLNTHSTIGQHALKRAYQLCKTIMTKAVNEGKILRNPVTMAPPKLPPSRQAMIPTAKPEEFKKLVEAMPERTQIAIYLATGCGLRISEVCALQRKDIDLTNKTIFIRHGIMRGEGDVGSLRLKAPKTPTSYRTIDIPDVFVPVIASHLRTRPKTPETTVIEAVHGGIMNPNTLRAQFERARVKAGRPDLHFHTLRATFNNGIIHQGNSTLKETMELTGHTSATVNALYQRADEHRKREAVNLYGDYLANKRTREQVEYEIKQTEEKLNQLRKELLRFK